MGLSPRGHAVAATATHRAPYDEHEGMCNAFPMYAYRLPDGREAREVVQDGPWRSGPHWFLSLEVDGVRIRGTDWTDQEIADACDMAYGSAEPTITADDAARYAEWEGRLVGGKMTLDWSDQRKFERWQALQAVPAGPTAQRPAV